MWFLRILDKNHKFLKWLKREAYVLAMFVISFIIMGFFILFWGAVFTTRTPNLKQTVIIEVFLFFILVVYGIIQNIITAKKRPELERREREWEEYTEQRRLSYLIQDKIKNNNNMIIKNIKEVNYKKIDYLRNVDPFEFEKIVAEMYRQLGYEVRLTPKSNDKGFDIILMKENIKYLVECKRYSELNLIGRELIQKFFAAVYNEKALKGYFITTSDFRKTAIQYIKGLDDKIELIDYRKLLSLLELAYPDRSQITEYKQICNVCGMEVIFNYPDEKIRLCSNGHTVSTNIELLIQKSIN